MRKVIQGHRSQAWRSPLSSEGNHNLCKTQRERYSPCCPPGGGLDFPLCLPGHHSRLQRLENTVSKATEFPSLILPLGSESQALLGHGHFRLWDAVCWHTLGDAWQVPIVVMTEETTWVTRDRGGEGRREWEWASQRIRDSARQRDRQRDLRNSLVSTLPGTLASQLARQLSHNSQLSNCLCSPSTHPLVHKMPRPLLTRLSSSASGGRGMPTAMKLKEWKFVTHSKCLVHGKAYTNGC